MRSLRTLAVYAVAVDRERKMNLNCMTLCETWVVSAPELELVYAHNTVYDRQIVFRLLIVYSRSVFPIYYTVYSYVFI